MAGSIPIENTVTVDGLNPLLTALLGSDLLMMTRPDVDPQLSQDYKLTITVLKAFIIDGLATLQSPAFTDVPTAPTAEPGDDSTQIATTAFVQRVSDALYTLISEKIDIASIVDDLTTFANDQPLSAYQGTVLKDFIDSLTTSVQQIGSIYKWKPNTWFYSEITVNDVVLPPQIVEYQGSLYVVVTDFQSGSSFQEKISTTLVLSRLSMDVDKDYLEMCVAAHMPFVADQEIGAYIAMRPFIVDMQHALPNDRLGGNSVMHIALANTGLASNNIVTIRRLNYVDGTTDTIGTITFGTVPATNGTPGVFAFNDSKSPSPTEQIVVKKGDVLTFTLTTTTAQLQWVRLNMLGTYVNFVSPMFSASFGA